MRDIKPEAYASVSLTPGRDINQRHATRQRIDKQFAQRRQRQSLNNARAFSPEAAITGQQPRQT